MSIAEKLGCALNWSQAYVGILILGIGTSLPEIVISLYSNLKGHNGLLLGNILGSNIANSALVLGVALLFAGRSKLTLRTYRKSYLIMLLTGLLILWGVLQGSVSLFNALLMLLLGLFALYQGKSEQPPSLSEDASTSKQCWGYFLVILVLLAVIFISAQLTVHSGLAIASAFNMQESAFGALGIAIATSLPEIAVAGIAAKHKQMALAFSTVIGSNIANVSFAIGLNALIKPIATTGTSMPTMAILSLILSALILLWIVSNMSWNKSKGAVLLVVYALFTIWVLEQGTLHLT